VPSGYPPEGALPPLSVIMDVNKLSALLKSFERSVIFRLFRASNVLYFEASPCRALCTSLRPPLKSDSEARKLFTRSLDWPESG